MAKSILWTLALLLSCSVAALPQGGTAEQQVAALESQMTNAVLKGDTATIARFLADNYVRVVSNGMAQTRQEALNDFKNGVVKFSSINESQKNIHVSGDTAVVSFKADTQATIDGKQHSGQYRGLRTWVKQKGQWKVVAFSTTPITNEPR